ncbi:MAG TPA: hypothetical protein VFA78_03805 [Chloroflexota bacterium]|nr:hypothetical protein [Chloroflexota bacterium]
MAPSDTEKSAQEKDAKDAKDAKEKEKDQKDIKDKDIKETKEKESKEYKEKEEKEVKEKDDSEGLAGLSQGAAPPHDLARRGPPLAEPAATGRAFIRPEERPAVGERALRGADEDGDRGR